MNKKILFSAALLAAVLFGCSESISPSETVEKAFDAVKTLDKETAGYYLDYERLMDYSEGDALSSTDETSRMLLSKLDVEIQSEEEDGDRAVVLAKITNTDLKPVFDEYVAKAADILIDSALSESGSTGMQKKMQEAFLSALKEADGTVMSEVEIALEKRDGNWVIVVDDALQDAVFGGLSGEIRRMVEENSNG